MSKNIIQGSPTKGFFIDMITRDISIKDAILDLIDNSIDGANNINPESYDGLSIDLTVKENEFIIKDNCGGFSLDIAQKYAFRFGRPEDAPITEGSIGRFGVGMKRALFKIGNTFEVESKTSSDHFQIDVNVREWKKKRTKIKNESNEEITVEDWNFNYNDITSNTSNLNQNGTYIQVTMLNSEVSTFFKEDSFLNDLRDDIERLLNFSIEKNLKITLNGESLNKKGIVLFNDKSRPYSHEFVDGGVSVKVIAGLSYVGEPNKSGWYIYCNDRLVLEADRTDITCWGIKGIPKWHIKHVMFRGIIFFNSKETIKLPLTTTKRGIDASSQIYQKSKLYMREAMNSIFDFLNQISNLGSDANNYRELLGEQEDKMSVQNLKTYNNSEIRKFIAPELIVDNISQKNDTTRISFVVNKDMANKIKNHAGTKSNKELGEYIFDYFIKMEELEEDG